MIDVESELKSLENSLRDFIEYTLRRRHGNGWVQRRAPLEKPPVVERSVMRPNGSSLPITLPGLTENGA